MTIRVKVYCRALVVLKKLADGAQSTPSTRSWRLQRRCCCPCLRDLYVQRIATRIEVVPRRLCRPPAGEPHNVRKQSAQLQPLVQASGCNIAGFVMVKKVPGTLHFTVRGEGHTFDPNNMNLTHHVHSYYFGTRPSPRKEQ